MRKQIAQLTLSQVYTITECILGFVALCLSWWGVIYLRTTLHWAYWEENGTASFFLLIAIIVSAATIASFFFALFHIVFWTIDFIIRACQNATRSSVSKGKKSRSYVLVLIVGLVVTYLIGYWQGKGFF